LALLSDAGHNLTDALALLLAWLGFYFQSKPANEVKTYGYHRAGVLSAFVNALTLLALSAWIFWESYQRLRHPSAVREEIMILVSVLGILLNAGIMWGLRRARRNDINVRSAYVHMLGYIRDCAAWLRSGSLIGFTGWEQIVPLVSLLICIRMI